MRYTHILAIVAFIAASAFMTSEALAQWSDGGPEMYPLTYPVETVAVKSESGIAGAPVNMARVSEALPRWSDGGPEMYPLTYPMETTTMEAGSKKNGCEMPHGSNVRGASTME